MHFQVFRLKQTKDEAEALYSFGKASDVAFIGGGAMVLVSPDLDVTFQ